MRDREREDIVKVAEQCERYWLETNVPDSNAREMRDELMSHLEAAVAEGKPAESVIGTDIKAFAEEWASVYRTDVTPQKPKINRRRRLVDLAVVVAIIAAFLIGWLAGPKEESVDVEIWRWVWVGAAVVLGVAEMVTGGFFLLPFTVGAIGAAALSFLGVTVPVQLLVFIIVSLLALLGLQRFAKKEDEVQHAVGANRFINRTGRVIAEIDPISGLGKVRMETEEWRATTDGDIIPPGAAVRVLEVRGTRLVVEEIN